MKDLFKFFQRSGDRKPVERLAYDAFFSGNQGGAMLEIGAPRPDILSLSAVFREHDWCVLSVQSETPFGAPEVAEIGFDLPHRQTVNFRFLGFEEIDCLAIDLNFCDLDVLKGLRIKAFRPRVVIFENLLNKKQCERYMLGCRYHHWKTEGTTAIYAIELPT